MQKRYLIMVTAAMTGCSLFGNTPTPPVTTIPLPPQRINASDEVMPANPGRIRGTASGTLASAPVANSNQKTIQENRSNGEVTQIKVTNGNDLPDYYMYPSQQQNLNTNSTPDKNLSTPSWQISW